MHRCLKELKNVGEIKNSISQCLIESRGRGYDKKNKQTRVEKGNENFAWVVENGGGTRRKINNYNL